MTISVTGTIGDNAYIRNGKPINHQGKGARSLALIRVQGRKIPLLYGKFEGCRGHRDNTDR